MRMKKEWNFLLNSPEKLTDIHFIKERLTNLSELRELLNLLTEYALNTNRVDLINLLLAHDDLLEHLCIKASDVKMIVQLLPEAKDKIIDKINTNPSILSKFVKGGGLPNLRTLFEISELVFQRNLLRETLLTNETLLIESLQSISHLEEMIYTLSASVDLILPTVLANQILLRRFLKEDLEKFVKPLPSYKNEILDSILRKDVLFKEQGDLNESTLRELATCFPEQLEAIIRKCKIFDEALFQEMMQTSREINKLLVPDRFKNAPLCAAVFNNEKEKIAILIQQSNNINSTCSEGFTALHWACMRRDETLIRDLISQGADSKIQNKYGKTALDYYCYQIRLDDFKSTLDYGTYQRLKKEGTLAQGPVSMKEFNLVFWNEPSKALGAPIRNKKTLKMVPILLISQKQIPYSNQQLLPLKVLLQAQFLRQRRRLQLIIELKVAIHQSFNIQEHCSCENGG
ncbi:Substrate of the Dot/Icm secretion system [Legionella santicrucis]|uniref:Substrate of the Dot/Icm secretion system n=1 Tax=Legionella santicrucis TaxID=45074 RepID=A0A0W0YI37_9GAMM|nr:ankyrin repeat domain-containing protein [Legionella santicrucis]KTD56308.1 Substrate of the Dot/Icm secretion system [Legionella santicrucis]